MNKIKDILNVIGYQKSETKAWMELLNHLGEIFKEKEIKQFITNPNFSIQEKVEMLMSVMNKFPLNNQIINLVLAKVIEYKLINNFQDVIASYQELSNQLNNVINVTMVSANKLSEKEVERIKDLINKENSQRKVNLNIFYDESLICGAKLIVGDKVIDNSVKNKIEKLKQELAL